MHANLSADRERRLNTSFVCYVDFAWHDDGRECATKGQTKRPGNVTERYKTQTRRWHLKPTACCRKRDEKKKRRTQIVGSKSSLHARVCIVRLSRRNPTITHITTAGPYTNGVFPVGFFVPRPGQIGRAGTVRTRDEKYRWNEPLSPKTLFGRCLLCSTRSVRGRPSQICSCCDENIILAC